MSHGSARWSDQMRCKRGWSITNLLLIQLNQYKLVERVRPGLAGTRFEPITFLCSNRRIPYAGMPLVYMHGACSHLLPELTLRPCHIQNRPNALQPYSYFWAVTANYESGTANGLLELDPSAFHRIRPRVELDRESSCSGRPVCRSSRTGAS